MKITVKIVASEKVPGKEYESVSNVLECATEGDNVCFLSLAKQVIDIMPKNKPELEIPCVEPNVPGSVI